MKLKSVKKGNWYETKSGFGEALQVSGVHPPAVKFNILLPFPRGQVYVVPRDIIRELNATETAACKEQTGGAP